MGLVLFFYAAEQGAVRSQRYDPGMDQGSGGVFIPFASVLCHDVNLHGFAFFNPDYNLDSALGYLPYRYSKKIDWSSVNGVHN